MRILQIHNINQVAQTYRRSLLRHGHTVALYEPSLIGGLSVLPIKLALIPWRIFDLRRVIGKLNLHCFDLAHIHWASYGILGLTGNIPFVLHCHGDDVRTRLQQRLFSLLLTPMLRRAAVVLCITPDILPIVQTVRPDAQFFPAPVDTERFVPQEECSVCPPCSSHSWTTLLFARLDANKGVDIATQGLAQFVSNRPDVRVVLLCWGDLRDMYKQRYEGRFEFVSRTHPDTVEHLIHSADVIVGQFALGALGLSELQAMSCAKPVICSFRYQEAYTAPAPLLQANTPEEIRDHLENLFQHPENGVTLGKQAREWVIQQHGLPILSDKLVMLYQSILERKHQRTTTMLQQRYTKHLCLPSRTRKKYAYSSDKQHE